MTRGIAFVALLLVAASCRDERVVGAMARVHVTGALAFPKTWRGDAARLPLVLESIGTGPVRVLAVRAESPEIRLEAADPQLLAGGTSMTATAVWSPAGIAPLASRIVVDTDVPGSERVEVAVTGEVAVELDCDDGNACTDDRFDRATGACEHRTERRPCDDGNACTLNDTCSDDGACVGTARPCDDHDVCTTDVCDGEAGCVHLPVEVDCDDGNPCTRDVCDGVAGCAHPPLADGTACGPLTCAAAPRCVRGTCHELPLGALSDGLPCDDGDACTSADACHDGRCEGSPSPSPACTCSVPPARPGTSCAGSHAFAPLPRGTADVWDGRLDDASERDCLTATIQPEPGVNSAIVGRAAIRFLSNPGGDYRFAMQVPCGGSWCRDQLLEAWDYADTCYDWTPYPEPEDCNLRASSWPSLLVFSVYRVGDTHPRDGYRLEVSYR